MRAQAAAAVAIALVLGGGTSAGAADLSFESTPYPKPGIGPTNPVIADVDGARGPEILVGSGANGKLYSFPNQGGGALGSTSDYTGCGGPAYTLDVSEWGTADGRPDAVLYCYGAVAFLPGNGSGFAAAQSKNVLGATDVFATGELNGAGQREFVFSGQQPFMGTHGKPLCTATF